MNALIMEERVIFRKKLFDTNALKLTSSDVAFDADTSSRAAKVTSRRIADILSEEQGLPANNVDKYYGQTLGKQFETLTMGFIRDTFPQNKIFVLRQ